VDFPDWERRSDQQSSCFELNTVKKETECL
jgi:hypothetical protein